MKRFNFKVATAIAALLLSSGTQAAVQDIAANGSFESGDFSGWETYPNGGTQSITGVNPSDGDFAANLFVPVRGAGDPPVDNLIKNANLEAGNLTPGAAVTVTWDMRGSLEGAGGVVFVELFSELDGGGTSKNDMYSGGPIFPGADWQSFVWNTTLGPDVAGGVTLQLKASCGPVVGCGVDAYFDNVTISTEVAAVPLPAAAWLFGSALVGLAGLSRKKKAA